MNRRIKTASTLLVASLLICSWLTPAYAVKAENAGSGFIQNVNETERMGPQAVPGRLLVKYREGATSRQRTNMMMATGARRDREVASLGVHVLELPAGIDEEAYARSLRSHPDVEYAEPDYICYPVDAITPDDPLYSSQWHLPAVSCPAAWGMSSGSDDITVAICDTGVDPTHPDLSAKLVAGWNVVDNNTNTSPVSSHGTWTAGAAAAAGNNSIGVASPALNCRIMPIRVSSIPSGSALMSDLVEAVIWAADHGARVASVSYMAGGSSAMADAGRYIQSKGGLLVVAAGNTGFYNSVPDSSSIFVVGATSPGDGLASFSTTGSYVDLSAPGVGILTTGPNGTYQTVNGTSFSAPLVAGTAALMLSVNPNLAPAQIDNILKVTADDLGPAGWDPGYGWGRLNVARAVACVQDNSDGVADTTPPAIRFAQPQSGGDMGGLVGISSREVIKLNAIDDQTLASVSMFADGVFLGTTSAEPHSFFWNTANLADGSAHTLTAVAKDQAGNATTVSTTVVAQAGFDITPPQVAFASPTDGQRVHGAIVVSINATDNSAVTGVDFYVDNEMVGQWSAAPYAMKWKVNKLSPGNHTLMCIAYDAAGNSATTSIVIVK